MQHRPVVVSGCVVVITAGTTTAKKRIHVEMRYSAARWVCSRCDIWQLIMIQ